MSTTVDASLAEVVPGSFRDPRGFCFTRDGVLYRQVNPAHRDDLDRLSSSGLYERLVDEGLLVRHDVVDPALGLSDEAYAVLRPDPVPFVSYPYEWSFSQLRDAALTTLRVQELALDHGMSLRDASAYNVQFVGCAPLLIDTLSLEVAPVDRPWVAYRQFCQHFLAPLALMAYRDVRLGQLLRVHLDGVPLDLTAELLPRAARRRPSLQMHLVLHARSQARHAHDPDGPPAAGRRFTMRAFRGLLDSLRTTIERLEAPRGTSTWSTYYDEASHYSDDAAARKLELVEAWIRQLEPRSVWDLGANTGRFAALAAARGIPTVALDLDPFCVDEAYRTGRPHGRDAFLPLLMDLANPSPAVGWANRERMTLAERGPADLVLALALVHHLAIGNNVPLPMVADLLAEVGTTVAIEWIPKDDVRVRQLLASREDVFVDHTVDAFERAIGRRFEIERREDLADSGRVLYLLRRR